MDTYTNDQEQYMKRMNQTAQNKFDLLKQHLTANAKILDFGSGYSPEFIEAVTKTLKHKQVQNATTLEEMFNVACFEAVSGTPSDMPSSVEYITPLLSHPLDDRKVHRNFGLAVFSQVDIDFFIEVGDVFATINWVFDENNQVDVSKNTSNVQRTCNCNCRRRS